MFNTPVCNLEVPRTADKTYEGLSKYQRITPRESREKLLLGWNLQQRNNEKMNIFLTQNKLNETGSVTPNSQQQTAMCTPVDYNESDCNTGKTN